MAFDEACRDPVQGPRTTIERCKLVTHVDSPSVVLIFHLMKGRDFEAFEQGRAAGLGPQANLAGRARKPSVGRDKKLPAVEKYREAVVSRRDAERVPGFPRHIDLHASDQLAPSGGDAVQGDVVLERVGACRVVIVRRPEPDEY